MTTQRTGVLPARPLLTALVCLGLVLKTAAAARLSLEEVLAHADQSHPELEQVRALKDGARAEQQLVASLRDFRVTFEAALRGGRNTLTDSYSPDHLARVSARKTLWDGPRYEAYSEAARLESEARALQLMDARSQRRLTLMTRYFDVLLSDLQHAADTEHMAVRFVRWDDAKHRLELGELSASQLAELEAEFQAMRLRQQESERRARERRALLASAMNRPDELPAELVDPPLPQNERPLPAFDVLLAAMQRNNPALRMQQQLLAASRNRLQALRADNHPTLEFEAEAAAYSRESTARDHVRAGINLVWPLYTGKQRDARLAKEQAAFHGLQAQYDKLLLDLRQSLFETWQEIQYLRDVARRAARIEAEYRNLALERAQAEYELELRTNLGTSMAETQVAKLRQRAVEYRLALAWERLAGLIGGPIEAIGTAGEAQK
ncbi:MAG: TolC family protein [Thiobacillaceae bacterium]